MTLVDDLLREGEFAHYGKKGMRWGVRRPVDSSGRVVGSPSGSSSGRSDGRGGSSQGTSSTTEAAVVAKAQAHGKASLSNKELDILSNWELNSHASGNQKSSTDHERATKALEKASTHGHQALSNEELNALTKRIESEKKFVSLTTDQKSALQKQVDQLRLEKDYRQLSAEAKQAKKSAGRKIIDSIISSASDAAMKEAGKYGKKLVQSMLDDTSGTSKPLAKAATGRKTKPGPFKVNPNKVKFSPTSLDNLPASKKRR